MTWSSVSALRSREVTKECNQCRTPKPWSGELRVKLEGGVSGGAVALRYERERRPWLPSGECARISE